MRCRFKHKIFQNEENGYTIAIFTTQDTSVPLSARDKYLASRNIIGFSAIGFGLPLTDEIELEMEGRWESGEHGTQYQVENFMEVVPRTKEGILGYLSSGAVKGIGPKMADTIFRKFGLQTLEIMENNPQELLKIRGISEKKLAAIVESYGKNQVFRELMTFLAPFKVTPKKVNMILKKFGNESVDIIRHRPYMLSAVKGFGFLTVDAIGRQCCCALNDPMRISGCIGHIMNQAMKEGHLFKQRQEVIREALEMLNRDLQVMAVSEQDVSQVLYRLVLQKSIVVEEERIYSIRQYEEETQTASMIARRLLEKPVLLSIEPELEKAQKTLGITLSETQKQAVRMVFAHPISIITGGPGTGKTTVLKVILYIHQALCRSEVQLMAPTGRAARRMVESTGCENASTMHLALGLLGDDTDFEPDFEYLSAGFLNVDEVSMVDMHLAYEFFRRVSRHARVLLVGDARLPETREGNEYGLATSTAAKAFKARLLLYAASPLFNGNSDYSDFKNHDGTLLMNLTYDPNKWKIAADAAWEAIQLAEKNYSLYEMQPGTFSSLPEPKDQLIRTLRFSFMDKDNCREVIFAETRKAGPLSIQRKSIPWLKGGGWNGIAPTMTMIDRFYTKNGLPVDEDPEFDYPNRLDIVTIPEGMEFAEAGKQTLRMHLDREPRFYAWVAFQNGYFECLTEKEKDAYAASFNAKRAGGKKWLTGFLKNENCGLYDDRTNNYSKTGYLNKKAVHPGQAAAESGKENNYEFPWPVIRLAELYLNYAEACVGYDKEGYPAKGMQIGRAHV